VASGAPVATILRPARTPKGTEVCIVVKHVTKPWASTGDSHYGRVEAMEWAGNDGDSYIFGLAGNAVLDAMVAKPPTICAFITPSFDRLRSRQPKLRTYASFMYQATKGVLRNNLVTFSGASGSELWCNSIPHESHEETCSRWRVAHRRL